MSWTQQEFQWNSLKKTQYDPEFFEIYVGVGGLIVLCQPTQLLPRSDSVR